MKTTEAEDNDRPNPLNVEAVVEHVQETDDVVMCQPPAPGATRYLWSPGGDALYLMHCGKCNYAGEDALRRYKSMMNGRVEMRWRDSSREHVMNDAGDMRVKEA